MTIAVEVLDALLSAHSDQRVQAETYLQSFSVNDRSRALLAMLTNNNVTLQDTHALLVAVLLRRDILKLTDVNLLEEMVAPLLQRAVDTASCSCQLRVQIGHSVAAICSILSLMSGGNSTSTVVASSMSKILATVSNLACQADVPALRLLAELADCSPVEFARQAVPSLPQLVASISNSTKWNNNWQALEALTNVVVNGAISTTRDATSGLSPASATTKTPPPCSVVDSSSVASQLGTSCLSTLAQQMITCQDGESLKRMLQHWSNAASLCPSLLAGDRQVFEGVVATCLQISKDRPEEVLKLAALQVLSSLCAVDYVKRKILVVDENLRNVLVTVVSACAELVASGTDDDLETWAAEPASDQLDWDDDDVALYAEELLESILHSLGGPALGVVLPLVETLLTSTDWKHQRAALAILECCLSATPVSFMPHQPVAIQAALSLAKLPQLRVQFQAIRLLGALCENYVQEPYAASILQSCSQATLSNCSKVACVACMAIVSFCRGDGHRNEEMDGERLLVPYLSDVLSALVSGPLSLPIPQAGHVDTTGAVVVKRKAVGAVACLAEASGEAFVQFYGNVMPGLLACSRLPPGNNHGIAELVGASLEAATIVGQSLGSDHCNVFRPDAERIIQFVIPILQSSETGMIPIDQVLSACARIASVMRSEYAPFVNVVLPHLLDRAKAPPDVSLSEGDEVGLEGTSRDGVQIDDDLGTESMTVALPGKGATKVTVNTTKIQEKAQAARAVYEHAAALEAAFGPYAEQCLEAFCPLINFQFSSEVRSTAAQTVAAVFEAACCFDDESQTDLPTRYLPIITKTIAKQIHDEETSEMEVLYALADALSEVYYSIYHRQLHERRKSLLSNFSLDDAQFSVSMCMNELAACLNRRARITHILSGGEGSLTGDDERKEIEGILQEEERLLTPLVDSIGYTLKFLRRDFVPIFETKVVPVLGPYLNSGTDIRARLSAVCLFDDAIEHCGSEAASKFSSKLMEGVLLGLNTSTNGNDEDLLRASIYGLAQIARYGPTEVLAPHSQTIFQHLVPIARKNKNEVENLSIFENAVSALASLTLIGRAPFATSSGIKREMLIDIFLDNLPLREDEDEAKICHEGLCDMIEKGLIGAEFSAKILKIIGETFQFASEGEGIVSSETGSRLSRILAQIQRDVPSHCLQETYSSLCPEAQRALDDVLRQHHVTAHSNVVTP